MPINLKPWTGATVVVQWTSSGSTTDGSTLTYSIPAAAQGKSTILAGDGQIFYQNYTINGARTQITFNSSGDVPPNGSPLEFLYV